MKSMTLRRPRWSPTSTPGSSCRRGTRVACTRPPASGRDPPSAGLRPAEQRGEGGRRVEPGQAQPVHRAVTGDQRRRLQVGDDGVVLDPRRWGALPQAVVARVRLPPVGCRRARSAGGPHPDVLVGFRHGSGCWVCRIRGRAGHFRSWGPSSNSADRTHRANGACEPICDGPSGRLLLFGRRVRPEPRSYRSGRSVAPRPSPQRLVRLGGPCPPTVGNQWDRPTWRP